MRRLLSALAACLAALAAGGASPVFAQESAGGYTTRVGGQTFGTETYKITTNADGSRRAEADASFGGTKLRALTAVGADGRQTARVKFRLPEGDYSTRLSGDEPRYWLFEAEAATPRVISICAFSCQSTHLPGICFRVHIGEGALPYQRIGTPQVGLGRRNFTASLAGK
jgi:hypothetical protein